MGGTTSQVECDGRLRTIRSYHNDVDVLTETHGLKSNLCVVVSRTPPSGDKRAGVAIMLSDRITSSLVLKSGSWCPRTAFVRLAAKPHNLFIVGLHFPLESRKTPPLRATFISGLTDILKVVPVGDVLILAGDFNFQLPCNMPRLTGRFAKFRRENRLENDKLVMLLRDYGLCAANTFFHPGKKRVASTFKQSLPPQQMIQLDYIFVPYKWKNSVRDAKTNWRASVDRHGRIYDHSMVYIHWTWRLTKPSIPRKRVKYDYSCITQDAGMTTAQQEKSRMRKARYCAEMWKRLAPALRMINTPGSHHALHNTVVGAIAEVNALVLDRANRRIRKQQQTAETESLLSKRMRVMSSEVFLCLPKKKQAQWRNNLAKTISRSRRRGRRRWVATYATKLATAAEANDSKAVWRAVRIIAQRPRANTQPLLTLDGSSPIYSTTQQLEQWRLFLWKKHQPTDLEATRPKPPVGPLPQWTLTQPLFDAALSMLKGGVALGPSEVDIAVVKHCPPVRLSYRYILTKAIETIDIPMSLVKGLVTLLYKKGPVSDYFNYRPLTVTNTGAKILSAVLFVKLVEQCSHFIPQWQRAYMKNRSHVDLLYSMTTLFRALIQRGRSAVALFLDWRSAFPSISHKFLQLALKRAGADARVRALIAQMYHRARNRVQLNGQRSAEFPIGRGILEGDVASPFIFIIGLHDILKQAHALVPPQPIIEGGLSMHTGAFADDIAIIAPSAQHAQSRSSAIATVGASIADMHFKHEKIVTIHIRKDPRVSPTSEMDILNMPGKKYKCPLCQKPFLRQASLRAHAWRCPCAGAVSSPCVVRAILGARGPHNQREYLIKWAGTHVPTWEIAKNVDSSAANLIQKYFRDSGTTTHTVKDPPNPLRCFECGHQASSTTRAKFHLATHKFRSRAGSVADKLVRRRKVLLAHADLPRIKLPCTHASHSDAHIQNKTTTRYLGAVLSSNALTSLDIEARSLAAAGKFNLVGETLTEGRIPIRHRSPIFRAAVLGKLLSGSCAWTLSPAALTHINGFAARGLSRMTGRTPRDEATSPTVLTLPILMRRRLGYLKKILLTPGFEQQRAALTLQLERKLPGGLTHGLPAHVCTIARLTALATDTPAWNKLAAPTAAPGRLTCRRENTRVRPRRLPQPLLDPPPGTYLAWTDGSCYRANKPNAAAGLGVHYQAAGDRDLPQFSSRLPGSAQTNNRAELFAPLVALRAFESLPPAQIQIRTDSAYLVQGVTLIPTWRALGWRRAHGALRNVDIWRLLGAQLAGMREVGWPTPVFRHVPAHTGLDGNEEADRLAKIGAGEPPLLPDVLVLTDFHLRHTILRGGRCLPSG
jgi:ribonuclease HI